MAERPSYEKLDERVIKLKKNDICNKGADKDLKKSMGLFEKTFIGQRDATFILNSEIPPKIKNCNSAALKTFGYTRQELLGRSIAFLHVNKLGFLKFQQNLYQSIKGVDYHYLPEFKMKRKDGTVFPIEHNVYPLQNDQGVRIGWISVVKDITKRKQAEKNQQRNYDIQTVLNSLLRYSLKETTLEKILKRTLDLVLSISWLAIESRGSIFLVEDNPEKLVMKVENGLQKEIKKTCAQISFGRCHCGRAALTREIQFSDGLNNNHEFHYKGIDNHGHYCVPIAFRDSILGVICIYLKEGHQRNPREEEFLNAVANTLAGIIIRKQAEDALRESEKRYRMLFEKAGDAIFILEAEGAEPGKIVAANQAAAEMHGYTIDQLLAMNIKDLDTPDVAKQVPGQIRRMLAGEWINKEITHRKKDGTIFSVEISAGVLDLGSHKYILAFDRNITKRKKAEKALRKRENELLLKSNHLIEVNAALKVLLKRREEDKIELGENVLANVKELVFPYLEKLKKSQSESHQLTLVDIVESNLRDIISPFLTRLSSRYLNLTPTEIQVASMIKHGRTTKEIAALLHLSVNTIRTHRYNLRSKLDLKNKKMNLRAYLMSLQKE